MAAEHLIWVFLAFGLGGVLKGATGAGAPFLAIPLMAILVNVPFAVAVFVVPNIVSNAVQIWRFRTQLPEHRFAFGFAGAGMIGAGIGTFALVGVSGSILSATVAMIVFVYVGFRILNPGWSLAWGRAKRLGDIIGGLGGIFQGAIGLSAPISLTFMNAVRLERPQFVAIMSLYFFSMALVQLPIQLALGVMTWERIAYSVLAVVPLLLGMPFGEFLGRKISKANFDRLILIVLTLLAIRLMARGLGFG